MDSMAEKKGKVLLDKMVLFVRLLVTLLGMLF